MASSFMYGRIDNRPLYCLEYPGADLSHYTYGDVYRIIYGVESAEEIVSITAKAPNSNNTDVGLRIKEIGTHTYTERSKIELFYDCTVGVVCNGFGANANPYADKYTYSFSKDLGDGLLSSDELWAGRHLKITLRSGTTIDGWMYTALKGQFYESGCFTVPMEEEDVYAINSIFRID